MGWGAGAGGSGSFGYSFKQDMPGGGGGYTKIEITKGLPEGATLTIKVGKGGKKGFGDAACGGGGGGGTAGRHEGTVVGAAGGGLPCTQRPHRSVPVGALAVRCGLQHGRSAAVPWPPCAGAPCCAAWPEA